MKDLESWWEIAKFVGAGGAFVLGAVAYKLWNAYQSELTYSKARDREMLTVLNTLTTTLDKSDQAQASRDSGLQRAIENLSELIREHLRIIVPK
jgi:hypothetical protein